MTKATQLAIEVHYVPLPANELEERKARLRLLLLRGMSRWLREREQLPGSLSTPTFSVPSPR